MASNKKTPEVEFQNAIKAKIQAHWDTHDKAILLSKLGFELKSEKEEEIAFIKEGLRKYIENSNLGIIVRHPDQKMKIGVIPSAQTLPENQRILFGEADAKEGNQANTQLYSAFWEAFFRPIVERRFVVLNEDASEYLSVVDAESAPTNGRVYEITKDDLPKESPLQGKDRVQDNWRRLKDWIERHELSLQIFETTSAKMARKYTLSSNSVRQGEILGSAISSLEARDQARIAIPLDIVIKMLSIRS